MQQLEQEKDIIKSWCKCHIYQSTNIPRTPRIIQQRGSMTLHTHAERLLVVTCRFYPI